MTLATINRVRYAGMDFETHLDDLLARLQVKFAADYNDFALASTGMMLIDLMAFGQDTLSFYLDRQATETYLSTARTRRAVSRLTRQLGYKMGGAVSSSTDLTVSIDDPQTINVTINENFQFQGPDDLIFRVARDVTWSPAEQLAGLEKSVPVTEGVFVSETFVSDGTPNQVFEISRVPDGQFVSSGSVVCKVNGSEFTEKEFLDFGATDQFEVAYNDDPPTIRFGDGVIGNIPMANATIAISYVATTGKLGEVAPNTIIEVVNDLIVSGNTVGLSVNNARRSSGGDDPETLEHAKTFAGRVFNSRRVAVTRDDYNALAGSFADPVFGRVAVAQAISSRSAENDLFLQTQLSTISGALTGPVEDLRAATTAGDTALAAIETAVGSGASPSSDSIRGLIRSIGTSITQAETNVTATQSSIRSTRLLTFEIEDQCNSGKTEVENSSATGPEQTAIKAFFDDIIAKELSIRSAAELQLQTLGGALDQTDSIGESVSAVQIDGSDAFLTQIETQSSAVSTQVGTSPTSGLYLIFDATLVAIADALDPDIANNDAGDIAQALDNIFNHVDEILAADCRANLVSVPILTRDAAGFYTEPSNGLVDVLQTDLTARKEVTQTVRVVSGGLFLIYPVIAARLGVKPGFSLERTRTSVENAIDSLLRGRAFGLALYISDLNAVVAGIAGIAFINFEISGHKTVAGGTEVFETKLDQSGNLIISKTEVITKRSASDITVTPEATGDTLLLTTA